MIEVLIGGAITLVVSWIFFSLASRGLKRAVKKINELFEALHAAGLIDLSYDENGEPHIKLNIPGKGEAPPHDAISVIAEGRAEIQPPQKNP